MLEIIDNHNLWVQFAIFGAGLFFFYGIISKTYISAVKTANLYYNKEEIDKKIEEVEFDVNVVDTHVSKRATKKDMKHLEDIIDLKFKNSDNKMELMAKNIDIKLDAIKSDINSLKKH